MANIPLPPQPPTVPVPKPPSPAAVSDGATTPPGPAQPPSPATDAKPGKKRRQPLLRTLHARTRFIVVFTTLTLGAIGILAMVELRREWIADATAANERFAAAVTSGVTEQFTAVQDALAALGKSAVSAQTGPTDCPTLVGSAAAKVPFAGLGLATPASVVLCQTGRIDGDIMRSATLARALSSGKLAYGNLTSGGAEFVLPVRDGSGSVAFLAFAFVPRDAIAARLQPGAGFLVGVADARGNDLVHFGAEGNRADGQRKPSEALNVEMLSLKDGSAIVDDTDGVRRIYSFHALSDESGGRFYLYAAQPTTTALGAADLGTLRAAGTVIVLTLAVLWLMLALGDLVIARRARKLDQALRETIEGKRDPDKLPGGFDELANVPALFRDLKGRLDEINRTMEQRIKARTSSLELSKEFTDVTKARTEALLASIGEGVVATDLDGKVTFFNDRARASLWWNPEAVLGVPISSAYKLEDEKENVIADDNWPIWKTIRNGAIVLTPAPAKPFYIRRADQSRFPVRMTISPIRLGDEVAGALVVFTDITDEVEFDRRKSEFISIASHQLRSPISAMKWMTDMLRKGDFGPLTEKQMEWVEKLFVSSQMMADLVNELLNISRLEAGVKMAPADTDTNKFVDNTLEQSQTMLMEKKQTFAYDRQPLPHAIFDSMMIGEVFKNMISNAVKYSPEGSTIGISVLAEGTDIRFSIHDQGMGIPKSDYNQMFNKFFRAENALQSTIKGTGLGLFFCKSAVEAHGGKVGFDSEVGKGSTFWFILPVSGPPPKGA